MKTAIISALLCLTAASSLQAQNDADTLYYDKNWKGVESKEFATYYRILPKSKDANFAKRFRTYYITGELQGEGEYVSIDKYNDKMSVFADEVTTYYKSGKIASKSNYVNGQLDGTCEEYSEDGLFLTKFVYSSGKPVGDTYTTTRTDNGITSQISYATGKPIVEQPSLDNRKIEYKDGEAWTYYNMNGIVIGMTNKEVNDYGKYYQLPIAIMNNSLAELDFNPDKMTATLTDNKGKVTNMKVLSSAEYMKKVDRSQSWSKVWNALAEASIASDAGKSSSTSVTTYGEKTSSRTSYSNNIGYKQNASKDTKVSGTAATHTTTYNGAAAYGAYLESDRRIAEYNQDLQAKRDERNAGYLKHSTIKPGESVAGYINIERKKGETLSISLNVDGITYPFVWDVSKKKK